MTEEHEDLNTRIVNTIWLGLATVLAMAIISYEYVNLRTVPPKKPVEVKQVAPEKSKNREQYWESVIKCFFHGLNH